MTLYKITSLKPGYSLSHPAALFCLISLLLCLSFADFGMAKSTTYEIKVLGREIENMRMEDGY